MQKALDQMNLQLHHVISDITGLTGLAIVDAILAGERDATKLAALRNRRIHATVETITKALGAAAAPPGAVVWDRKEQRVAYVVPTSAAR